MTDAVDASAHASDERWAAAADLARNVAVPKKRSRRWWTWAWIIAVAFAAAALAFALTAWIVPTGKGGSLQFVSSRLALQSTVIAAMSLVLLYGLVWGSITERIVERSGRIIDPLNRQEKRRVRRQLAGKAPVDVHHLPIILSIAQQSQRMSEGAVPIQVAWILIFVAIEMGADPSAAYQPYFSIPIGIMLVFSSVYLAVSYLRTARFIKIHTAQPSVV